MAPLRAFSAGPTKMHLIFDYLPAVASLVVQTVFMYTSTVAHLLLTITGERGNGSAGNGGSLKYILYVRHRSVYDIEA
jgi:hypothetical protein